MTASRVKKLWQSLPFYLKANLATAISFLLAFTALQFGFPYLLMLVGTIIFFVPGWNLTKTIERLSGSDQEPLSAGLWTIIFSLILTPAMTWLASLALQGQPFDYIVSAFLSWWGVSLVLLTIFHRYGRPIEPAENAPALKEIGTLLGLFIVAQAGAFIIYPFIPEADSYTYLMKLREIRSNPILLGNDGRPLFLVLTQLFSTITSLDPYWLFKLGLPLLGSSLVVSNYLIVRKIIRQKALQLIIALSPLYFPVIFQELLISRPQSIFLLVLAPALYFYGRLSLDREKPGNVYWILGLIIIGALGLKIHALFTLIILLGLIALLVFYGPLIARRPLDAVVIGAAALLALYPWLSGFGLLGDLGELGRLFIRTFRNSSFEWWFLDHYRNVDGNEAGWPGLSAIYYYGYNLGLFLPVVLALFFLSGRRKKRTGPGLSYLWPAWITLGLCFLIAEVAPRFDLAFLPDRAWLPMAVALGLLLPLLIVKPSQISRKTGYPLLIIFSVAAIAIVGNWGLTYVKSGWITPDEYPAASFIRQTAADSVFLTQGGNHVLVRYFGERQMVRPLTDFFSSEDPFALDKYLEREAKEYVTALAANSQQRSLLKSQLERIVDEYEHGSVNNQLILGTQKRLIEEEYLASLEALERIITAHPTVNQPTYVLYSRDKYHSLYANRGWWRTSNFFEAKLEKFSARYPVVYDKNGLTIWKVHD